jgi:hypothetical protein
LFWEKGARQLASILAKIVEQERSGVEILRIQYAVTVEKGTDDDRIFCLL